MSAGYLSIGAVGVGNASDAPAITGDREGWKIDVGPTAADFGREVNSGEVVRITPTEVPWIVKMNGTATATSGEYVGLNQSLPILCKQDGQRVSIIEAV